MLSSISKFIGIPFLFYQFKLKFHVFNYISSIKGNYLFVCFCLQIWLYFWIVWKKHSCLLNLMKKCISKVLTLFSCKNRYSFAYAYENQPSNIDFFIFFCIQILLSILLLVNLYYYYIVQVNIKYHVYMGISCYCDIARYIC